MIHTILKTSLKLVMASLLLGVGSSAWAQEVTIAGKDWRQLTETTNFSYNDLVTNGICSASTGVCSGTLRSVDFTGWTWATVDEVGAMFEALGIGAPNQFDTPVWYYELDSAWAPLAIDVDGSGPDTGFFHATWIGPASADLIGITRTLSGQNVYTPGLVDWCIKEYNTPSCNNNDIATTARTRTPETRDEGIWLYRPRGVTIYIDIRPASDSNCLKINGNGVIPVAIFGNENVDIADIDTRSLYINGSAVRLRGNKDPSCGIDDLNGDEYLDMMCHFEDDPSQWQEGTTDATLTGKLMNGTPIEGTESICVTL